MKGKRWLVCPKCGFITCGYKDLVLHMAQNQKCESDNCAVKSIWYEDELDEALKEYEYKMKKTWKMHYQYIIKEKVRYLCNWGIIPKPEYLTTDKTKVTCENCKVILAKFGDKLDEYEKQKNYFLERD